MNVLLYWIKDLKLEIQCDKIILNKNLKRIHGFLHGGHLAKISCRGIDKKLYRYFLYNVSYMCKWMALRLNLEGKGWKGHMDSSCTVSTKLKRDVRIP